MLTLAAVLLYSPVAGRAQQPAAGAQAEEQESTPEYIEQYEAWEKADKETDLLKRGTMLAEWIQKYPKSELMPNAKASYRNGLLECDTNGKYQELETLAEQWLKLYPSDLDGLAFVSKAAEKLGHNDKWIQSLLDIYKIRTTADFANAIADAYKKTGNNAKYLEWKEVALKYPESETDFRTRLELVQVYLEAKNSAKAIEYAQGTIKAADLTKDPSAETRATILKVKRACYDTIGKILMDQDKYEDAIKSFRQALKVEKYSEGYYLIALCLDKQSQTVPAKIDDVQVAYAKAEKFGGEFATKAKERLEQIYRNLHNQTLIGIEKIYRKAQEQRDTVEARAQEQP